VGRGTTQTPLDGVGQGTTQTPLDGMGWGKTQTLLDGVGSWGAIIMSHLSFSKKMKLFPLDINGFAAISSLI